jgi:two-component system, chemotaxis family, CheB/CheR fusion protein
VAEEETGGLEALLDFIKDSRGFDFTGYKRSSLSRRIEKRIHEVGVGDFDAYREYLARQPDEFGELFNTILINVTGFFRDPEAWEYLTADVIPRLLDAKPATSPIRVWSAGCASGEEAYTLAIVLAEAMGDAKFMQRVKIYATDVDSDALAESRHASYPLKALNAAMPEELVQRYFEVDGARASFRRDRRRSLIFGRNDLVQDAPISKIDLLVCRNTLIYFTAETQHHILANFHFALNPGGYLFLGKSEVLVVRTALFDTVDLKRRVFTRTAEAGERARAAASPPSSEAPEPTNDDCSRPRWSSRVSPRSWLTHRAGWPWRTSRPGACSASPSATSDGRSRTSTSRTGRWSCGPPSSRCSAKASRSRCTTFDSRRSTGRRDTSTSPSRR